MEKKFHLQQNSQMYEHMLFGLISEPIPIWPPHSLKLLSLQSSNDFQIGKDNEPLLIPILFDLSIESLPLILKMLLSLRTLLPVFFLLFGCFSLVTSANSFFSKVCTILSSFLFSLYADNSQMYSMNILPSVVQMHYIPLPSGNLHLDATSQAPTSNSLNISRIELNPLYISLQCFQNQ